MILKGKRRLYRGLTKKHQPEKVERKESPFALTVQQIEAKHMAKERIAGRWLIDSMDMWDRDFIDAEVRGFFEFGNKNLGSFQFGYVRGGIDYRIGERDDRPTVEFSWSGQDEVDPAQGRGWLSLECNELKGMFYIHLGDNTGLVLKRAAEAPKGRKQ